MFYTAEDFGAALGASGACGFLTLPASNVRGQQAHFVAAAPAKCDAELVHVLAAHGQRRLVVGFRGFCVVRFVAFRVAFRVAFVATSTAGLSLVTLLIKRKTWIIQWVERSPGC